MPTHEEILSKHGFVKKGAVYVNAEKGITYKPRGYRMPAYIACWWNILVIVIGLLVAIVGLGYGLFAGPGDSAPRQTVAALWVVQGILGLLIAAVGVLGLTYFANLDELEALLEER